MGRIFHTAAVKLELEKNEFWLMREKHCMIHSPLYELHSPPVSWINSPLLGKYSMLPPLIALKLIDPDFRRGSHFAPFRTYVYCRAIPTLAMAIASQWRWCL